MDSAIPPISRPTEFSASNLSYEEEKKDCRDSPEVTADPCEEIIHKLCEASNIIQERTIRHPKNEFDRLLAQLYEKTPLSSIPKDMPEFHDLHQYITIGKSDIIQERTFSPLKNQCDELLKKLYEKIPLSSIPKFIPHRIPEYRDLRQFITICKLDASKQLVPTQFTLAILKEALRQVESFPQWKLDQLLTILEALISKEAKEAKEALEQAQSFPK